MPPLLPHFHFSFLISSGLSVCPVVLCLSPYSLSLYRSVGLPPPDLHAAWISCDKPSVHCQHLPTVSFFHLLYYLYMCYVWYDRYICIYYCICFLLRSFSLHSLCSVSLFFNSMGFPCKLGPAQGYCTVLYCTVLYRPDPTRPDLTWSGSKHQSGFFSPFEEKCTYWDPFTLTYGLVRDSIRWT